MNISIEHWERMSIYEREATARRIAIELPAGFMFDSIRLCQLGVRQNYIAFFHFRDAEFVLIPGGEVTIGYDTTRNWMPNLEEFESWQATATDYELKMSLHDFIANCTLRCRQIELTPFLIETKAHELGWENIDLNDEEQQEVLRQLQDSGQIKVHSEAAITRFSKNSDGTLTVERANQQTHAELADHLHRQGFRFPTSDEWEYACGGGESSLFRWGEHVPCDRYPVDSIDELQTIRSRIPSMQQSKEFTVDWEEHRKPNAFGLYFASDPYKYELTSEIGTTRGGDGGGTICGGMGFFVGWLTLATAYFEEQTCKHEFTASVTPEHTIGRRVLSLK